MPWVAKGARSTTLGQQGGNAVTHRWAEAFGDQPLNGAIVTKGRTRCALGVDESGPEHFPLAHRQPPLELREIFGKGRLQHEGFKLAKFAGCAESPGPSKHFMQGPDIGRAPCETMRPCLLLVQPFGPLGSKARLQLGSQRLDELVRC